MVFYHLYPTLEFLLYIKCEFIFKGRQTKISMMDKCKLRVTSFSENSNSYYSICKSLNFNNTNHSNQVVVAKNVNLLNRIFF